MKILFLLLFFTLPLRARELFVKTKGDVRNPQVVFIHGSPGSSDTFSNLFAQSGLAQFYLLAPDRPGYGKSGAGNSEISLTRQAEDIAETFSGPAILIGYSYGGAVAVKLALLHPDKVRSLILLAPALDPKLEKLKWWQTPAYLRVIRNLLPQNARVSMEESIALPEYLRELNLSEIRMPVIYVQGLKDQTVSLKTADYVKEKFQGTSVQFHWIENLDHHVPEKIPGFITRLIREEN